MNKSPSIINALQKLRGILVRKDKIIFVYIVFVSILVAVGEILSAASVMILAQVIINPHIVEKYLLMLNFDIVFNQIQVLLGAIVLCASIFIFKNLIGMFEVFFQALSIKKMSLDSQERLIRRYVNLDYGFYLTRNPAFFMRSVRGDISSTFSEGVSGLAGLLSELIVFIVLLLTVIVAQPYFALFVIGGGAVISYFMVKFFLPKIYELSKLMTDFGLVASQNLNRFFYGFKEIVLLGKRDFFISDYIEYIGQSDHYSSFRNSLKSMPRFAIETIFVALFMSGLAFMVFHTENIQSLMAIVGGYLYVGFRIMPGMNRIIQQINMIKGAIPAIDRTYAEFNLLQAREHYVDAPDFHFSKSIVFQDIEYRYLNTERNALFQVNIEVKKGECIGIAGETGSGKSTFIDLLLGLLMPTHGQIVIDGQFVPHCYQWHKMVGYVPQTIYLIDDTVRANIAFGDRPEEVDEARVKKAIKAAQLDKFVAHLPEGLDTVVGERGVRLSGGERQRIAIARALYREPEVLVFDEATSALDNETEAKLMKTIDEVSQNRTVIMIAHRLSTLKNCNRVIVMEQGQIKEILSDHQFHEKVRT